MENQKFLVAFPVENRAGGGWVDTLLTAGCYTGTRACWDKGNVAVLAQALLPVPSLAPTHGMPILLLCHHPQSDFRGLSQPCPRLRQVSALQHGCGAAAQPNQPHEQLLATHTVSLTPCFGGSQGQVFTGAGCQQPQG